MRTLFNLVISTSCVVNYVTYASYVIHANYNGHVYDVCVHVFCDMCDGVIDTYGRAVIYLMKIFYMEIKYDCQWLVMSSLRIVHLLGLYNEIIMEYIGLEYSRN
jgi:hypothetical protein